MNKVDIKFPVGAQTIGDCHPECAECSKRFNCTLSVSDTKLAISLMSNKMRWQVDYHSVEGLFIIIDVEAVEDRVISVGTTRATSTMLDILKQTRPYIVDFMRNPHSFKIPLDSDIFRQIVPYNDEFTAHLKGDWPIRIFPVHSFLVAVLTALYRQISVQVSDAAECKSHLALAVASCLHLFVPSLGLPHTIYCPKYGGIDVLTRELSSYGIEKEMSSTILKWMLDEPEEESEKIEG